MTISIDLTEFAKKIIDERLKNNKNENLIIVLTEFERLT